MDDQDFQALFEGSGLSDAVGTALAQQGTPSAPSAGTNESQAAPTALVAQPGAADAAPLGTTTASSPQDPITEPVQPSQPIQQAEPAKPIWDSPDNPYLQQSQQANQFINGLHEKATTAREQREQAAADELIKRLPEMDPEQAQQVTIGLLLWERNRGEQRVQALEGRYEPHLGKYVRNDIFSQYEVDPATREYLEKEVRNPKQIAFLASKAHEYRQSANAETETLKQEIANLKANQVAIERRGTGVDLQVESAAGIPSDAQSIDDLVSTLGLGGWS